MHKIIFYALFTSKGSLKLILMRYRISNYLSATARSPFADNVVT